MEVYKLGQTSTNIYKWWIWGDLVATLAIPAIQILLVHGKLRTAGVRSVFIVSPTRLHNYTWNTKKVSSDLWDITWYPQVTKCTHFKVTPRVPRFSTANGSNWFCGRQHLISKAKPPKTRHHYIQSHLITLILTFFWNYDANISSIFAHLYHVTRTSQWHSSENRWERTYFLQL